MNVVLLIPLIVQGLHYAKNDNNYRTDLHLPSEQMVLQFRGTMVKEEKAKGRGWRELVGWDKDLTIQNSANKTKDEDKAMLPCIIEMYF